MPELPDLAGFRQYFESTSLHQSVDHVSVVDDRILDRTSAQALGRKLRGVSFTGAQRHGKLLFAGTSAGDWLVLHFGMTGSLAYATAGHPPEYAKVVFHFANGAYLAYVCSRMLGRVGWTKDPDEVVEEEGIGPDALSVSQDAFLEMLEGRRGAIKSLLMDQEIIAGLGNVYSDEVLFQARIRPDRSVAEIPPKERRKLHRSMNRVLTQAGEVSGDSGKLPERSYLIRHRGAGEACPRCGGPVEAAKIGGRTAYFCPACQE